MYPVAHQIGAGKIWAEVLDIEDEGVDDNFFDPGGMKRLWLLFVELRWEQNQPHGYLTDESVD